MPIISTPISITTVDDGENGRSAVNVILSPETVLITQSTNSPYTVDYSTAFADVSVNVGGVATTDFTVTVGSASNCVASLDANNQKRVKITDISYVVGQTTLYHESGYVNINVVYDGETYTVKLNFIANMLGTWKQTVIGDTEITIAQKITYGYNNESGSTGTLQAIGKYIRSSEKNISSIKGDIYDNQGNLALSTKSELLQTATSITQKVESVENIVGDSNSGLVKKVSEVETTANGVSSKVSEVTTLKDGSTVIKESQVTQYADAVTLGVRNGLSDTGIDITNHKIVAKADNFTIRNNSNTTTFSIDSDGNLESSGNASFKGKISATSGAIGGFYIGTTYIGQTSDISESDTGYTYIARNGYIAVKKANNAEALRVSGTANIYGTLYTQPSTEQNINGNSLKLNYNANNGAVTMIGNSQSTLEVYASKSTFNNKVEINSDADVSGALAISGFLSASGSIIEGTSSTNTRSLPSSPKTGTVVFAKGTGGHLTILIPSGYKVMAADGTGTSTSSVSLGEQATIFVYFGNSTWVRFNCN